MSEESTTDAEGDFLLERFDQTAPDLQRRIVAELVARCAKLQAFKDYVHARLDAAGVMAWADRRLCKGEKR